jgi:hypothetical protein
MRRLLLAALIALLVPALPAEAKFSAARVCGATDCHTVTFHDGNALIAIEKPVLEGIPTFSDTPTKMAPQVVEGSGWYRVTLCPERCDSPDAQSLRVVPEAGYQHLPDTGWVKLSERADTVYRDVTRNLEPLSAARLVALDPTVVTREPTSPTASHEGSEGEGIPAWGWIAIGAGAVGLGLLSMRWLRRRPPASAG